VARRNKIKMFDSVKSHKWIIINGFLMALIVLAPLLLFPFLAGDAYRGINSADFGRDEKFYLTRGHEILEGHSLGNAVLREGKEGQEMQFSYIEYILLKPLRWLGLSGKSDIVAIYAVHNFVGIFILSLLIYFFVLQLSGEKLLSVAASMFVIGGSSIVFRKGLFAPESVIYGRAFSPYLGSLFFFLYLNLLLKALYSSGKKRFTWLAGTAFGFLFYIYFFAWSSAMALNACLLLIYLFKKNFVNAKKILMISCVGALIGSYNLFNMAFFAASEEGKRLSHFIWNVNSHAPIFSKIGFASLILFAVLYFLRRNDKNLEIFLGLILAGWVTLNHQMFTGIIIYPPHFYAYFLTPVFIILGLYLVWSLMGAGWQRKWLFIFLIPLIHANAFVGPYKVSLMSAPGKLAEQKYGIVLDRLNNDQLPGVVLAADDDENSYLYTAYTDHDVFWNSTAARAYNTLPQRYKDALYVYMFLDKNGRDNFSSYIKNAMADLNRFPNPENVYLLLEGASSGFDFYTYMYKHGHNDPEILRQREALIASLASEYEKILKEGYGIMPLLKKYNVNHVVWDENQNPEWDLSALRDLKEVINNNGLHLYRL